MRYVDVEWLHSDPEYPTRLVSEIGPDDYETRKIEFWADGRVGYASELGSGQDTMLGEKPVPSIDTLNADSEFRAVEIDASTFESLWDEYVGRGVPHIECSITFLPASEGGRAGLSPAGILSGDIYRPHLVIGDPAQRHAVIAADNQIVEEYVGIAFHDGPRTPQAGTEMIAVLSLIYFPQVVYDGLEPGVTFTIREGSKIVGYGTVLRWLDREGTYRGAV